MRNSISKILRRWLCVSLLVGICSSSAIAALFSASSSTPIPFLTTDWTNVLLFPKFNPALGTLISFQLDLTSTLNTTLTITNTSPSSASFGTAKTEMMLSVKDVGGFLTFPQIDSISPTFSYNLAAGGSAASGVLTKTGTSTSTYSLPGVLTEFTGPGNISLAASTFTQTLLTNGGGNTFAAQLSLASATGIVTYNYNPTAVPEPGTALFGIACVGIAALRRRRIA